MPIKNYPYIAFVATIFFSAIMLHFKAYLLIVHLAIFTAIFGYIRRSVTSGGCDRAEARGMAGQITTTLEQIYFGKITNARTYYST
jgi:hypothetical protein